MPRFNDSHLEKFGTDDYTIRVDVETEPDVPEAPPTFDVYVWKDARVQVCPDGTRRHVEPPGRLVSLTRFETRQLIDTLTEALNHAESAAGVQRAPAMAADARAAPDAT